MSHVPYICPSCRAPLEHQSAEALKCTGCNMRYEIQGSIPILIAPKSGGSGFDYLTHYQRDSLAFDYFEERSGATEHSERRLREFILSQIPTSTSTILDVGCGSAWIAKAYQKSRVAVHSLDVSPVNPQKALDRYPSEYHVGVAADAFALPFPDSSLTCIVAAEIIEHVPDPGPLVCEMLRVLTIGGVLIVSTPYKEQLIYELCIHCGQRTPRNAHLHSFDERKLAQHGEHRTDVTFSWSTLNNKALLHARTHVLLRYLPFSLWRVTDRLANLIVNRPANIVALYRKQAPKL